MRINTAMLVNQDLFVIFFCAGTVVVGTDNVEKSSYYIFAALVWDEFIDHFVERLRFEQGRFSVRRF